MTKGNTMKEIETTIAEIELDDYTLRFEGVLDKRGWDVTMTYKTDLLSSKSWKLDDDCWDENEVSDMVWREVMRITQKYAGIVFSNDVTEICEECGDSPADCICDTF